MRTGIDFALTPNQRRHTENFVLITGAPRSGTTLVGKLLSSLKGIEYQYEPPTFYSLCAMMASGRLSEEVGAQLLKIYLYEDLLLESVQGRRANLRPGDDSLILNSISWKDLLQRWGNLNSRQQAARWIAETGTRLACKMPNVMDSLTFLRDAFPQAQMVIVLRDAVDVIRSLVKKGWFSEESLREELWPYRQQNSITAVPYWVEDGMVETWLGANQIVRSCYMWRRHMEFALDFLAGHGQDERITTVRYEELCARPATEVRRLAEFLGHEFSAATELRISEVRSDERTGKEDRALEMIDQLLPEQFEALRKVNRRLGYTTL